jgi:hypothetical protein
MVLSVTLSDGNNTKYLIKLQQADKLEAAAKERVAQEKGLILGAGEIGYGFEYRR